MKGWRECIARGLTAITYLGLSLIALMGVAATSSKDRDIASVLLVLGAAFMARAAVIGVGAFSESRVWAALGWLFIALFAVPAVFIPEAVGNPMDPKTAAVGAWFFAVPLVAGLVMLTNPPSPRIPVYFALFAFIVLPLVLAPLYALPRARRDARRDCCRNLQWIADSVQGWAIQEHLTNGSAVRWKDLVGPGLYMRSQPLCPDGGGYRLGNVGELPHCTLEAHGHAIANDPLR